MQDKERGSQSVPRSAHTAPQCGPGNGFAGVTFQGMGSHRGSPRLEWPITSAFIRHYNRDMDRKELCERDNCQSQNEFIEKAIRFYAGYVSGKEATAYLPPALVAAMRGTVQDSENRIARLLFKLAVEVNMMMNVLAAGMEISDEDLKTLRARSVREVKQTNGRISFKDAIDYQRGVE